MNLHITIKQLSVSAIISVFSATSAFATSEQFVELCSVSALPDATKETFDSLQRLVFGWNRAQSCQNLVNALKDKKRLDLPGNTFSYYRTPDLTPIGLLDWIEEIDISSQSFTNLEPLANLKLTTLNISETSASLEPLRNMTTLTTLLATFTEGVNHPANLSGLENLETLHAEFKSPTEDLHDLPMSINALYISGLGLKSLKGTERLPFLAKLNLNHVKLANLEGINDIRRHDFKLSIEFSNIKNYKAISKLKNIESLAIKQSGVTKIDFLKDLTSLKTLDLEGNQISDLAPLTNLNSLEVLNAAQNQIWGAPTIGNLSNLRILLLNHNNISTFTIGNWPHLVKLDLTKNHLNWGPRLALEPQQYKIEELNLDLNGFHSFSEELGKISTIKHLSISGNKLLNVDNISKLYNLEALNIADNKLVDISVLSVLTRLKHLTFHSNPLANSECPVEPASVCQ